MAVLLFLYRFCIILPSEGRVACRGQYEGRYVGRSMSWSMAVGLSAQVENCGSRSWSRRKDRNDGTPRSRRALELGVVARLILGRFALSGRYFHFSYWDSACRKNTNHSVTAIALLYALLAALPPSVSR